MEIIILTIALVVFAVRGMILASVKEREERQRQLDQFENIPQKEKDRLAKMMLQKIIKEGR